jgi:hypothetical protein
LVNWASDARQHAITQAQRRKREGNPLVPLGGTPEYTGYARDPRDRSRTHFRDLSSSHPNNPTFSKLASQEDAYWKSGAWIPDAGLKTDTSIEETIGLVTGIPSLARLGATGVRAAVGSGRQALANRGVGGWTKVMDPGRREFMKRTASVAAGAAGVSITTNPLTQVAKKGIEKLLGRAKQKEAIKKFKEAEDQVWNWEMNEVNDYSDVMPMPPEWIKGRMLNDIIRGKRAGKSFEEIQVTLSSHRKELLETSRRASQDAAAHDITEQFTELHRLAPHLPPGHTYSTKHPMYGKHEMDQIDDLRGALTNPSTMLESAAWQNETAARVSFTTRESVRGAERLIRRGGRNDFLDRDLVEEVLNTRAARDKGLRDKWRSNADNRKRKAKTAWEQRLKNRHRNRR